MLPLSLYFYYNCRNCIDAVINRNITLIYLVVSQSATYKVTVIAYCPFFSKTTKLNVIKTSSSS